MKFIFALAAIAGVVGAHGPDASENGRSPSLRRGLGLGSEKSQSDGESFEYFNRISNFPICQQINATCDTDVETVAEIVAATDDGMTLIYSNSEYEKLGFVDITDPATPIPFGVGEVDVGGEPTGVAVRTDYAVVTINTSPDFVNPSGKLNVYGISDQMLVSSIDLGGQPDAVAVSPDKNYIAVAIENERDEDLGDGAPPQMPPGFLSIIDSSNEDPTMWSASNIALAVDFIIPYCAYPDDPEPEYVTINENNVAVVTLQENNCVVMVDLETQTIINAFNVNGVTLMNVDTEEEGVIDQTSTLNAVPREPDGVTWIGTEYFATADEGDLNGGSRGFTIFNTAGEVVFTSGNEMDLEAARFGHYPEERSGNKGNEPENTVYEEFPNGGKYLFVNSERSSLTFVYDVSVIKEPELHQILPTGVAPEGIVTIPSRNLVVVASEKDDRGDKIRSVLNIYELQDVKTATYPFLMSLDRSNGTPIPFSALSGLAAARPYCSGIEGDEDILYTTEDSFYKKNRVLTIDKSEHPALVTDEKRIMDSNDKLSECLSGNLGSDVTGSNVTVGDLINSDKTVNIDPEGIAVAAMGGLWLVSEGKGTVGETRRPFEFPNLLLRLDDSAVITKCVLLPASFPDQLRFGFEGVAEDGDKVVVAVQRAWDGDSNPRLAIYDQMSEEWDYVFYPLDDVKSQNGGWVGLSDIAPVGNNMFLVLERDNQGGPDAVIKRIYEIDLSTYTTGNNITKTLVRDVYPDLAGATNGPIFEKVEGLAVDYKGAVWVNNDNDGVDDNNGEQVLLKVDRYMNNRKGCPRGSQMFAPSTRKL